MMTSYLTMLEADEGFVLNKGDVYTKSVLLRKDETPEGWTEITESDCKRIMQDVAEQAKSGS